MIAGEGGGTLSPYASAQLNVVAFYPAVVSSWALGTANTNGFPLL